MNFVEYINSFVPLSPATAEELFSKTQKDYLPKHYLLHKQGEICQKLYYLEQGLARWYYYNQDGKDMALWYLPWTTTRCRNSNWSGRAI